MSQTSAKTDRGIRSIFATAMSVEERDPSRLQRLMAVIDRRHVAHALAGSTFGAGAALIGFMGLALSLPKAVSADPVAAQSASVTPLAKSDRLPTGGKLAAIASAVEPVATSAAAAGFTAPDPETAALTDGDASSAALGYAAASATGDAGAAIEDHIDRTGMRVASLGNPTLMVPGAAAAATQGSDDEEDDESIVAVPRARPAYEPPHAEALPLPRPRPTHLASVAPGAPMAILAPRAPGVDTATGPDPIEVEPAPPPGPRRGSEPPPGLLGFFSSPTEPVKAPPKTTIDTPFGVPYVLQTESVETACLKPELVDLLRRIEAKYHQKVIITSGFRDRGRQGSLHRQCAAADIQVPGVGAPALAAFARTIPGIGGVGTYCHATMIHVDIGTPRDWKYGCGSFFAMRGAPGKWGKVPAALAAAQPSGAAKIDVSQMAD